MAVANNASAMPGATTASVVSWRAAIAENEFMMPHTVPNSPMNGAVAPTVARNPSWRSRPSVSRMMVTDIALSMRSLMPGSKASRGGPPSKARRHSRKAETNTAAIG